MDFPLLFLPIKTVCRPSGASETPGSPKLQTFFAMMERTCMTRVYRRCGSSTV